MKKLFLILAAAMMTASVSAQKTTVTANKTWDNWYIGFNAGAATPMHKYDVIPEAVGFFKGFAPTVGVRVGKNLTTVFGLALDANVFMGSADKSLLNTKTFIDAMNLDLMASFNLMNAFAGYKGEPRTFEISALVGGGWSHFFGVRKMNTLQAKAALDFAFNLGAKKAWQFYIEPAVIYGLKTWGGYDGLFPAFAMNPATNGNKFDSHNGLFQLTAGIVYKFGNSNGTHNFKIEQLRDQAEIDGLNSKINELRSANEAKDGELAAKDRKIRDLQNALDECNKKPVQTVKPATATNLQPTVLFRQGKSVIDKAQYAPIELIASYMKNHPEAKVEIKGYASPEGSAEFNQKLSEKRAQVVKDTLVKKYKIAADRLSAKGCGVTDKLFEEVEFNRVATFNDNSK